VQTTPKLLCVKNLKKYFPIKKNAPLSKKRQYVRAVEDVSLEIYKGETFALVGESGCGKSTLGRTVLQLLAPSGGEVLYYGTGQEINLAKCDKKRMRILRKELQIIFQDPYSSLNPRMTVGQIIGEGPVTHKYYAKGSEALKNYVLSVMEKCGLPSYAYGRYPHEFSGGQRQRICIARALALKPKFIVCDECVSALDVSIQSQILNLLQDLKEKEGLTYLFISHDLGVVRHIASRIAVMYLGEIVETGDSESIFENPLHPYTVALTSVAPVLPSAGKKEREKILLEGSMPNSVFPPKGCKFHTRCFMAEEICKRCVPPFVETEEGRFVRCHFAQMPTEEKRRIAQKRSEESEKKEEKVKICK